MVEDKPKAKRIYTVEEVLASMRTIDFDVKFLDGVMMFRYHPLRYGNLKMLLRAKKSKDTYERGDALLRHCIKILESDASSNLTEKELTPELLDKLPSGIVSELHGKLGEYSGLAASEEELKKLLESMTA